MPHIRRDHACRQVPDPGAFLAHNHKNVPERLKIPPPDHNKFNTKHPNSICGAYLGKGNDQDCDEVISTVAGSQVENPKVRGGNGE